MLTNSVSQVITNTNGLLKCTNTRISGAQITAYIYKFNSDRKFLSTRVYVNNKII